MGRVNTTIDDLRFTIYDFDYDLPEKYIAQFPKDERDGSRLFVLNRKTDRTEHRIFKDIIEYFSPGDCIVINRTKVFPAKVFCKKNTGGNVELLFLRELADKCWAVLSRDKILNKELVFQDNESKAEVIEKNSTGEFILKFRNGADVYKLMKTYGEMPLPPYIKRKSADNGIKKDDFQRYQTIYAKTEGSVAAPTAGLHFTDEVIEKLRRKGIQLAEIILHVGWGTFRPIVLHDVSKHNMLPEYYEIREEHAGKINSAKKAGKRIIAIGTTSVRTLETVSDENGIIRAGSGQTNLFIYQGYKFKCVDAMITNFHLPKSTPIVLVSAFAEREKILNAYRVAMENNYRFYSYGDAMLIL